MFLRNLIFMLLLPVFVRADTVTVFAAASLKNALEEVAESYDGAVRFSFAGSSVMARQVAAGAPADVVILANVAWMDWLEGQGALVPGSQRTLLRNHLVLITGADGTLTGGIDALAENHQIAMALVEAVPAGIYGREALEALDLWDSVRARVIQTDNVRAALALVALGEVPLGLVYGSDARAEQRVRVLAEIDPALHSPILYPAALVAETHRGAEAEAARFLDYLSSPEARNIFETQGFSLPPS
ncbi:molybdate ABC transporter substrate-binding protein [Roseobacteraceae bacterium S113]